MSDSNAHSDNHSDEHPFGSPDPAPSQPARRGPMPLEPLSAVPGNRPEPDAQPAPEAATPGSTPGSAGIDLSLDSLAETVAEPSSFSPPTPAPSVAEDAPVGEPAAPLPGGSTGSMPLSFDEPGAAEGAPPEQPAPEPTGDVSNMPDVNLEHAPAPQHALDDGPTPSDPLGALGSVQFEEELTLPGEEFDHANPPAALTSSSFSPRHQLEAWLAAMVQSRASDLILRAGGKPSCRVDGKIRFLPGRVPGAGALLEVLDGVVGVDRMQAWHESGSVDVAVHLDGLGRFRLNAYKQMGEPAVVLRRISDEPPLMENLGLPTSELKRLAGKKRGIILVTGIAGSGKSTTLAAIIQYMNLHFERHVVTLEDPVEMMFTEDRCVISQREVGTDCPSFHEGLRHALRQSPDVILIGEMRDAETVNAALDATETGHLVLSTLHTVNAAQTVDRILSFFPAEQHAQARARLAENLGAVMSQRLIPRATGKGLVPAFELMSSTPHIRELLVEGRTAEISRVIDTFRRARADLVQYEPAQAGGDRLGRSRDRAVGFGPPGRAHDGPARLPARQREAEAAGRTQSGGRPSERTAPGGLTGGGE